MPVAEALSVVGSIIAIVQISKTIISCCRYYLDGVEGAPSDLRVILIEVSAMKAIAKSLQYLTQPNVATSVLMDQLAATMGPIDGCEKALKELEALFPPVSTTSGGGSSKRRKLNTTIAALAWPLKSGKAKKLLQEIIQYKVIINLALTAEFVQDLNDVKQKTEKIQSLLTETERQNLYKWLETTNPSDIHNRSQRLYEPGTGSWVQNMPEWSQWITGALRCLWIHGIPGAGKSILASYLAEEVEKHCKIASSDILRLGHTFYYCYFGHNQDESSHFLRWVICQLCRQSANIPDDLLNNWRSGRSPSLPNLLSLLYNTLRSFKRVYIVLDAVDESMPREDLLKVIQDLATDPRFSNLSMIVTSRRYVDIEQVYKLCSVPISMSNHFVENDIRTLVSSKVQTEEKFKKWSKELTDEMVKVIPERSEGMFRWAICQLDILKRLRPDVSTIRAALKNLPKTLDETYDRIFTVIPEEDRVSVQHVFHWLAYNNDLFEQNMPLNILLQAVQKSTSGLLSPGSDQLHDFDGLRECCGCLIMIEQKPGPETHMVTTATFAHYTVKEYLTSPRILNKTTGFFALKQNMVRNEFSKIALREALAMKPNALITHHKPERFRYSENDEIRFRNLLESKFDLYCGVGFPMQMRVWQADICSDLCWQELCEACVNPLRPTYPHLVDVIDIACSLGLGHLCEEWGDWSIRWLEEPDPAAAIFLQFLALSSCHGAGSNLALAFARRNSMLNILNANLHIAMSVWQPHDQMMELNNYTGTIPQIIAQWAGGYLQPFLFVLLLIHKLGVQHFDLSTILLLHIGSHEHEECENLGLCTLEKLLAMGAKVKDLEECYITPLQVATTYRDFHGVTKLLRAGADPNGIGGNASKWPLGSAMASDHHGASPLYIVNRLGDGFQRAAQRRVKKLLLKAGAKEIITEDHYSFSHRFVMESDDEEFCESFSDGDEDDDDGKLPHDDDLEFFGRDFQDITLPDHDEQDSNHADFWGTIM